MKNWLIIWLLSCLLIEGSSSMAKEEIKLPAPKLKSVMSVEEAIYKRRSKRDFLKKDLSLEQISQLCFSAQGKTEKSWGLRAAPSAGALYPLEIYLVKSDGVFHYIPEEHKLLSIVKGDRRDELAAAALGQSFIAEAPVDIVITAVYQRTRGKYGTRAERYVHIEAGHAAQNIHLQAVALGLGSVPIGAFFDEAVKSVLNLPKDHEPIYIIPVGYAR